jgi:hypothetical protein
MSMVYYAFEMCHKSSYSKYIYMISKQISVIFKLVMARTKYQLGDYVIC